MAIPARFQADCHFCGEMLDIRRDGTYQHASGWVKRRSGGGANALALPERLNMYAHETCIDTAKHRHGGIQMELFSS